MLSLPQAISKRWSDWIKKQRAVSELSKLKCYAEEEIERIADDMGVSAADIHKLVRRGSDAANLLLRRMAALDLDRNEVSRTGPRVFRELNRNCALCDNRRRCVRDLARDSSDPVWEEYCPNAGTLLALNMLPRIIGAGRAAELLYSGRAMDGTEAERWGFYNRLCEPDALLGEVQAMAKSLADGPTFGHAMTKRCIHQEWSMGIDESIEAEAQAQAICMQTKDYERAYEAFVKKSKPVFDGN